MSRDPDKYGWNHRKIRAQWAKQVRRGGVVCWRCGWPIEPDEPFDLGHDDHGGPRDYIGPEHVYCSRSAGARKRHERDKPPRRYVL